MNVESRELAKGSLLKRKVDMIDASDESLTGVAEQKTGRMRVGKGKWRIGIASIGTPFWFWAVTSLGCVKWIDVLDVDDIGDETGASEWRELLIPLEQKLTKNRGSKKQRIEFQESQEWNRRSLVDVVFFEGGMSPGPSHPVWSMETVQVVVWIGGQKWSGPPLEDLRLEKWSKGVMKIPHQDLGGVTDLVSWIHFAERTQGPSKEQCKDMPRFVDCWADFLDDGLRKTTMRGVIDPTVHGRECKLSVECVRGARPSSMIVNRKLRWKIDRFIEHTLPSVFASTGLVKRRLTPKEIAITMDFPAGLHKRGSDSELARWLDDVSVPFKVRVQVVNSLREWTRESKEGFTEDVKIRKDEGCLDRNGLLKEEDECPDETRMTEDEIPLYSIPDSEEGGGSLNTEERREDRNLKATKSDDAKIPTYLWDNRICQKLGIQNEGKRLEVVDALNSIRKGALRYWKRRVCADFWSWWKNQKFDDDEEEVRDQTIKAGLSALEHAARSSWWDWDMGSSPFFWRMPDLGWMTEMRDGVAPMWIGPTPAYRRRQHANPNEESKALEKKKLTKVRKRGYIAPTPGIKSLTSFFSVPKGEDDIRMVYDGTKSGLNAALFSPWFGLGNVNAMLRSMEGKTWSADNDFGEMFLNFWVHPELRCYTGIDITDLFPEELKERCGRTRIWEAWTRCAMGLTTSPYQTTQCAQRVKRIIFGDRSDPENIFGWVDVRLNLPGDTDYDPSLPWISKINANGDIAADVHPYVDDLRETAPSEEEAWLAASKMAKGAAFFGLQDAARKRREPSKSPGAWAGAIVETGNDGRVYKTVAQDRWNKTKAHVERLSEWAESPERINRKELERIRGFLVYVSLTYDIMVPYLKGIHLTLESWRQDQDGEGWRLPEKDRRKRACEWKEKASEIPPDTVAKVPRYDGDIAALMELTKDKTPPRILARPLKGSKAAILFGDASGEGFGSSLWIYGSSTVETEHGLWTRAYGARSSNFRELYNLVLRLEALVDNGTIEHGSEVFMFTDNSTAEAAFYRGTSSTKLLYELVLRTKRMEMRGCIFLRVVWVAGTRMIEQGTDGLSRGDLMTGVMAGSDMLLYVPLNKTVEERQSGVVDWITNKATTLSFWKTLSAQDWFDQAFEQGNFVWIPPPAIADVAVDQLCEARHVRTHSAHVFICPALMSNRWRKKLGKVADFVLYIPVGCELWSKSQHEPLIVAFLCPFLSRKPWQVKRAKGLLDTVDGELSELWPSGTAVVGNLLRKLWTYTGHE